MLLLSRKGLLFMGLAVSSTALLAQGPPAGGGPRQPPPPPTAGMHIEVVEGSATYRVVEQFVGVSFTNDAVGTTTGVTGQMTIKADGAIDSGSKLSFDLKGLKSDQDMRDGFIRQRTLETDKFPTADFVPTKIEGLDKMIPSTGQAGIKLTGNLTIHGVTKEVSFTGIATFNPRDTTVAGRAKTELSFSQFGLTKPSIGRLANVDDKIELEIVYKFKRS